MSKQCTMILSDHITDTGPIDAEPIDAEPIDAEPSEVILNEQDDTLTSSPKSKDPKREVYTKLTRCKTGEEASEIVEEYNPEDELITAMRDAKELGSIQFKGKLKYLSKVIDETEEIIGKKDFTMGLPTSTDEEVAQDIERFKEESVEFPVSSSSGTLAGDCMKGTQYTSEERDELYEQIITEDEKINEKINKLSDKLGCCVLP